MPRSKEAFEAMRDATRQKIETATLSLVARKGISVTIEEIAKYAGVSKGLLYNHYSSKEALLAELAQQASMKLRQSMSEISEHPTPAIEKIKQVTTKMCDMLSSSDNRGADYFMFMAQVGMSGFPVQKLVYDTMTLPHSNEILAQMIATGQSEGSIVEGDPAQLAMTYWATIQGLCCHLVTGASLKVEPSMLLRILVKG